MALEDFAGKLLDGRLWFGKYPTDEEVTILEAEGFTHIINLCTHEEIIWISYVTHCLVINYPFEDGWSQKPRQEILGGNFSTWTGFLPFITTLIKLVDSVDTKVYIHCKGGHGRSPMFCAIICGVIEGLDATTVLELVHAAHQKRKVMKPKWRKLGAPQRTKQKKLVVEALASLST